MNEKEAGLAHLKKYGEKKNQIGTILKHVGNVAIHVVNIFGRFVINTTAYHLC